MKTVEIDMSETALGRFAALMKRNAAASVLDFTDEEWANLQKLRDENKDAANAVEDLGVLGASVSDNSEETA